MNFNSTQTKSPCSPAQALAMKNAALRAVLGYLEYKQAPGDWHKDELTSRFHRMVELALEAPCELEDAQQSRFLALDRHMETQS